MTGTESDLTILADGKLMFKEGLYIKPATGTGAGTQIITSAGALQNVTAAASIITSGTFSTSRIPNLAASKITSGTISNDRLPTVTEAFNLDIKDTRSGQLAPSDVNQYKVSAEFTNQIVSGNDWHSLIQLKGWHDGYVTWQLIGPASTPAHDNLYFRSGVGSSWGTLQRIFHDGYHPNADKWTTQRTLSLTGAVTGSVNWDGSANASIATTLGALGDISTGNVSISQNKGLKIDFRSGGANIGIGAGIRPSHSVGHTASSNEGIFWHSDTSNDYGIYRVAGSWSSPGYSKLRLRWPVGIELDGGSGTYTNYGVNLIGSSPLRMNGAIAIDSSRRIYADYSLLGRGFRAANRGELHLNATGSTDVSEIFFGYGDGYTQSKIRWGISDRGNDDKLIIYKGPHHNSGSFGEVANFDASTSALTVAGAISSGGDITVGTGSTLKLRKTLTSADFDAIHIAYTGSWSQQPNYLAGINVTDSTSTSNTVGRFGITYSGSGGGAFVVSDLYTTTYGGSGEVFRVRSNGQVNFTGDIYYGGNNYHRSQNLFAFLTDNGSAQYGKFHGVGASATYNSVSNYTGEFNAQNGFRVLNVRVINGSRKLVNITGLDMTDTAAARVELNRSSWVTFYGNNSDNHAIGSRSGTGGATDDIRINSYGSVFVNLDSNSNNSSGANFFVGRHGSGTGTIAQLFKIDGEGGNVTTSGNVTAFGSPSDIRLKKDIERISDPVSKVQQLDGVTFTYKKDGARSTGLIAQQLLETLPEVVYETEDLETGEQHYAVRYGNVVGLLVEAIKEQQDQIDQLKDIIEEMKNGNH